MENQPVGSPELYIPPSPAPVSTPAITKRRSRAPLILAIVLAVLVVLGGGGYFAYSKGYISVPFLSPKSDTLFTHMVTSLATIKNAQYGLRIKITTEPRIAGAKPLVENTNLSSLVNGNPDSSAGAVLALFNPDEVLSFVPSDMSLDGGISFYAEANKTLRDSDAQLRIDGTYTGGDLTSSVDLEARKVGENLYGIVTKFPSLPIPSFDISAIKGQWVVVTPDDQTGFWSSDILDKTDTQQTITNLRNGLDSILKSQVFTLDQKKGTEAIAGVQSEHYLIALHPDKLPAMYQALIDAKKKSGGDTTDLQSALTEIQKPANQTILQGVAKNSTIELWVDKVHGYLRQARWTLVIVPPDSATKLKGKQVNMVLTLSLDKVNEKVAIAKPSSTISYDKAGQLVTGISPEAQQFSKQTDRISQVRSALSSYKNSKGSYPNSLDELNSYLKTAYTSCQTQANAHKTSKTNDANALARDEQRKSDVASIRSGLALYYDDHNATYPTSLSDLAPTYMQVVPTDPQTKAAYSYQTCNTKGHFVLSTALETTTELFYANDQGSTSQSTTPLTCGSTTNTNSSVVSVDLGVSCFALEATKNGVNVTDVYTNKPYAYSLQGSDYNLVYTLKYYDKQPDYEKESVADGKNTATSTDESIEKKSPFEQPLNTNSSNIITTNLNVNTSTANTNISFPPVQPAPITDVIIPSDRTKDTDGDGLTDYDEVTRYRTNPLKADSDGDGHNDKEEVTNRYNPLGPGKATAQQLLEWGLEPLTTGVPPVVTSSNVSTLQNLATFAATTNVPTSIVVNYGETTSYGGLVSNPNFLKSQSILGGVLPGHTYHYVMRLCTADGGCYSTPDATVTAQ